MEYVIRNHASKLAMLVPPVVAWAVLLPWAWTRRVQRRRELMGMLGQPEYLLKDVGLQRSDITREGLKPFWRV